MSVGVDLVAIREALAAALKGVADAAGCEILAYVEGPQFPTIGVFPSTSRDYLDPNITLDYPGMQVEIAFDLRTAMPFGAAESSRLLDRMLSTGVDQELSLIDALLADQTLDDAVDGLRLLPIPPLNFLDDGLVEAVVPLVVMATRTG